MLTLDYANCLADRVGAHGIDPDLLDPQEEPARGIAHLTERLARTRGTGQERWRDLHRDPLRSEHLTAVRQAADEFRARADNLVVLGIGGSALGNIALQAALNPATYNLLPRGGPGTGLRAGPRVFVVDNADPAALGSVLAFLEADDPGLERTVFNVISKSGETAETAAQFMIVRDLLSRRGRRGPDHVIAITDPARGTMRRICDAEGYRTLPVPDGVGGRFSVLSPVGLFSAAMCGVDVAALLDGAASMDAPTCRPELATNPAALLAFLLVELGTRQGKTNHVLMPYATPLYSMADWYRQLWAESLGKKTDLRGETVYAGFTPIKALGTTDQHSQVQLYREGPNDKVVGFVEVADWSETDVPIPAGLGVEAIAYLEGGSLARLLAAEKRATEYALVESLRPNYTITFPRLDAFHVGQFIYLWEMATAYAGLLLNIDAYDQPAVELGKQATFGLMGRPGYEKHLRAVNETLKATDHVISA
ncbi:MAG TPA: glucose-6-phosphate isomerase [Phycisphaerales bacterium]|nr:glucose-6-phosphate isomerase [Phycisphaerales bacterium]